MSVQTAAAKRVNDECARLDKSNSDLDRTEPEAPKHCTAQAIGPIGLRGLLLSAEIASEIVSYLHHSADVKRFVFQLDKRIFTLLKSRVRELQVTLDEFRDITLMSEGRLQQMHGLDSLVLRTLDCHYELCSIQHDGFALPPNLRSFRVKYGGRSDVPDALRSLPYQLLQAPPPTLQSLRLNAVQPDHCEQLSKCAPLHNSLAHLHICFLHDEGVRVVQAMLNRFAKLERLTMGRRCVDDYSPAWSLDLSALPCLQDLVLKHHRFRISRFPTNLTRVAADMSSILNAAGNPSLEYSSLEEITVSHYTTTNLLLFCKRAPHLRRCFTKRHTPNRFPSSFNADEFSELLASCPQLEAIDGNLVSHPSIWPVLASGCRRPLIVFPSRSINLPCDVNAQHLRALPPAEKIECHLKHLPHLSHSVLASCTKLLVCIGSQRFESRHWMCDAPPVFKFPSASFVNVQSLKLDINFGVESALDFSLLRNLRKIQLTIQTTHERCGCISDWHGNLRDAIYSVSPSATHVEVGLTHFVTHGWMNYVPELTKTAVDVRHLLQKHRDLTELSLVCNVSGFDDITRPLEHKTLQSLRIAAWYGLSRPFGAAQFQTLVSNVQCDAVCMPRLRLVQCVISFVGWQSTFSSTVNGVTTEQVAHCHLPEAKSLSDVAVHPNWVVTKLRDGDDSTAYLAATERTNS